MFQRRKCDQGGPCELGGACDFTRMSLQFVQVVRVVKMISLDDMHSENIRFMV